MESKTNLERQLEAHLTHLQQAVASVSRDFATHPTHEVAQALSSRIEAVGNGASISDLELAEFAEAIASGKRVWVDELAQLRAED